MSWNRAAVLNLTLKGTLLALIVFYLAAPGLDQFSGKVMPLRAALFPIAAALIGLLWMARGRPQPYPHGLDGLVTTACLVDFGGNAAQGYSTQWFETAVHFTNMIVLGAAFGLALAHLGLPRGVLAGMALGLANVLHTLWEITEYLIDATLGADLDVTNEGIIRDLVAGLLGSAVAAVLVWWRLHNRIDLGGRLIICGPRGEQPAQRAGPNIGVDPH